MIKDEFYTLSNGILIPKIGFGTWQVASGEECYNSVLAAIKAGYKSIDTAYAYENETSVGKAIKDSGIKREELFITTKLPSDIKDYHETIKYFNESLKNLGLDYLDLYLIHAPWPWSNVGLDCTEGNIEAYKAMIDLYKMGKIRSIGVSNFLESDVNSLIEATGFVPHVNQMRYFIGNTQEHLYNYFNKHNILIEAYSPLGTGGILNNEIINKMASKYKVTPAQLAIRYCLEKGTRPLPKSVHEERILANLAVDFKISNGDLKILDKLEVDPSLKRKLRS